MKFVSTLRSKMTAVAVAILLLVGLSTSSSALESAPGSIPEAGISETQPTSGSEASTSETQPTSDSEASTSETQPTLGSEASTSETQPTSGSEPGTPESQPTLGSEGGASGSTPTLSPEEDTSGSLPASSPVSETGSLVLTMDGDQAVRHEHQIQITITPGESLTGLYGDVELYQGMGSDIFLTHGQSVVIEGLPAGAQYAIKDAYPHRGYCTTPSGVEGDVPAGGQATANFTCCKDPVGRLMVTQTVSGIDADIDKGFNFDIELSDMSINGKYGDVVFDDGKAEFSLKHGESVTADGLPVGTEYTVTEDAEDGYITEPTCNEGIISESGTCTASFQNTWWGLTVTERVTGSAGDTDRYFGFEIRLDNATLNGQYGDLFFENGVAEFKLKSDQKVTVSGLPAGTHYTVTEDDASSDGYTTSWTGDTGVILSGSTVNVLCINNKDAGSSEPLPQTSEGNLTVRKVLTGTASQSDRDFHFSVELSDKSISGTYGEMTFRNGMAEFALRGGETLTATGLPAGTTYKIIELEANEDGYSTTSSGATGTVVEGETAYVVFYNHRDGIPTGDLSVRKAVPSGDKEFHFHFTLTLNDTSINGRYGDVVFVNGVASFTLRDSETIVCRGLPKGVVYKVEEAEANQGGYVTREENASGTIEAGRTIEVKFVNTYEKPTGKLVIRKVVLGSQTDQQFNFVLELSDPALSGQYGDLLVSGGRAEFTLKDGEEVVVSGLPEGTSYTVTEKEADQNGFHTTAYNANGTVVGNKTVSVLFENRRVTGGLQIEKLVKGPDPNKARSYQFFLELGDHSIQGTYGDLTFVDGTAAFTLKHGESIKVEGLPAGITYKVTEVPSSDPENPYTIQATGDQGVIVEGAVTQITFVNNYVTPGNPPDSPPENPPDNPPDNPPPENPPDPPDNPPGVPQTGDAHATQLWLNLMLLSGACLLLLLRSNRIVRKHN